MDGLMSEVKPSAIVATESQRLSAAPASGATVATESSVLPAQLGRRAGRKRGDSVARAGTSAQPMRQARAARRWAASW